MAEDKAEADSAAPSSTDDAASVVSVSSSGKRKQESHRAAATKRSRLEGSDTEDASSTLADAVTAAQSPLPPSSSSSPAASAPSARPLSTLTSMPANEDELFSHYVEQRTTRSLIQEGSRSCVLETAYPPFWDHSSPDAAHTPSSSSSSSSASSPSPPPAPARVYPFPLDPFQSQAIASLERSQSVLVSAHTSAGKTVVAEYAIALALRRHQRVIYTSPIKALSNQKYRDLDGIWPGEVGLMTGDISINPSAGCLVMTTEILRNMLYRGSEVVREVSTIIYDEVHYMRNKERGVVWEETIIMLPHSVRLVFLSATIPNAEEFACWIAKLHHQPVNVVYTDYRPTPLQHYLHPAGSDGLHLVVDEKGEFREDNFQKALSLIGSTADLPAAAGGGDEGEDADGKRRRQQQRKRQQQQQRRGEASDIHKIVKMCMERHYQPIIVFSFSKRECEQHAQAMARLDFSSDTERALINEIFQSAISVLSADDQRLPQVTSLLPILRRGIGIHHSGLLPILKEVIEILFQEGLISCLFSTETFSLGLNMPAKTVVFTSVRKWDGQEMRVVSSGEYIQMSGRAGRRGLDERGIVICMLDEALEPAVARQMLKGQSDTLTSSFHLSYNMLLNLLRLEDVNPLQLMARSFHQFQSTRRTPSIVSQMQAKEQERDDIYRQMTPTESKEESKEETEERKEGAAAGRVEERTDVRDYLQLVDRLERERESLRQLWCQPVYVLPFLNAGRLVRVKAKAAGGKDWGWGVVVRHQLLLAPKGQRQAREKDPAAYSVYCMLRTVPGSGRAGADFLPAGPEDAHEMSLLPILMSQLDCISAIRIVLPQDMKAAGASKQVKSSMRDVRTRLKGELPLLSLTQDMQVKDEAEVRRLEAAVEELHRTLQSHPLHGDDMKEERERLVSLQRRVQQLEAELVALDAERRSVSEDVVMAGHLQSMQVVLRRLDCTSGIGVMDVKGRVAAEVSSCDELVAAELMLSGVFLNLDVPTLVALCSCLVNNDKWDEDEAKKLRPDLRAPFLVLQQTARRVGEVQRECSLPVDVSDYVARFSPALMEVVYAWCRGSKFADVVKLTDAFEGTIIRIMRRLEELLRQLGNASRSVGSEELEAKFAQGIEMLKRDIVFAASLYL